MSKAASRPSSQSSVCRSINWVRLALVTSVTWTRPPVSFQSNQLSIVPKAISPRPARSRRPSTLSRIHLSLSPEK